MILVIPQISPKSIGEGRPIILNPILVTTKTIKEIYGKFENLRMFPGMGADLSKRVSFRTDYKYAIWEDYVIIYKVSNGYVEIYRVVSRYQDITRIFE